ncbi:uncharacterized protein LOC116298396 [Actinia tenebrosa]|uniref:Uncharacterized protein LOC116298396 n=1 Tax=Actinia tenebrosa TaxID=6105 RepID=A0A6P8I5K6_ACTTE|nr:uncharacterized protein LOC116298396 [Actinia tenebrosa]XP_031562687.1 uncharacterized protein LOC116298396 [Actinia tenebrosa]XP_031562688.1 uncharacterized protein LOC116298396 [Actinia tenebrosa]XP_031562689.1 uncharacterized protein LOC116298396 [Actinia tenebrosa]XP_031562690.1 uncharacterized protein LOC116298396 [Actinia tenebrosa]
MGNKNCTAWNSILFPENEEEERLNEWLKSTTSSPMTWEYTPSFPSGADILPVQPVYKPDVRELRFRHENEKDKLRKDRDSRGKGSENDVEEVGNGQTLMNGSDTNRNFTKLEKKENTKTHDERETDTSRKQNPKRRFPTGRVYISISHDPITRRIKVAVIKAKNLSCKQIGPKDNCGINCAASYMDVSLYEGDQVWQSFTTAIKKGYSQVLYYENFAFDTNNLNLREVSLVITARHSHKQHFIKHSHDIGKIILQAQMNDDTMIDSHLVEAVVKPGITLYKWHTLWS